MFSIQNVSWAATLFFDDFEGDLSAWNVASAMVTTDPIEGDSALTFTRLASGGGTYSPTLSNPSRQYILSFDYLGTCASGICGGFIGKEPGDVWLGGNGGDYPDLPPDLGSWEHVVISFSGSVGIFMD